MNIEDLSRSIRVRQTTGMYDEGFWYLATPYSKYPFGQEQAFIDASAVAARLIEAGVPIFSPIAHTHPIAEHGGMGALDHNIWLPLDKHMMRAACGLVVAELPGWKESYGVNYEIEFFRKLGKPVLHLSELREILPEDGPPADPEIENLRGLLSGVQWTDEELALVRQHTPAAVIARNGHAPSDGKDRKEHPLAAGLLDYFPDALLAVANLSKKGNDQHNPGEPMHWARGKSTDHADCIMRHLVDRGHHDTDGLRHSTKTAWRALALLQEEIEQTRLAMGVLPEDVLPRGAREPEGEQTAYQRTGDAGIDSAEAYETARRAYYSHPARFE